MMAALGGWLAQALHLAMVLALAPVLGGLVAWFAARMQGARAAPPWQPWRRMLVLLKKRPVLVEGAGPVPRAAPALACAATLLAAALVPGFARGMALAPLSDLLLVLGLLGIAWALRALTLLEAGTMPAGIAVGRALALLPFAAPALLLLVLALGMVGGGSTLDAMLGALRENPPALPMLLAVAALAVLALCGTGRPPLPDAMPDAALEASGRHLALWQMQSALQGLVWAMLLVAIACPWGMAERGAGPLAWLVGLLLWWGKLALVGLLLALAELLAPRLSVFRAPEILGGAMLLAALAGALLFVAMGLA
jgi:formate hydrogenlyase subunit 4